MEEKPKPLGWNDIASIVLWVWPGCLAATGHLYAMMKVDIRVALYNERTVRAIKMWHFVTEHYVAFIFIALLLPVASGILRLKRVPDCIRVGILWALSLPIIWYWWECVYLGGKIRSGL